MKGDNVRFVWFLLNIDKLGNTRIRSILNHFCDEYDFFNCHPNEFRKIEGIDLNLAAKIDTARKNRQKYYSEFDSLQKEADRNKIGIISILSEEYPENLKFIYDAPVILYYKGKPEKRDKFSLSIVGTRTPTEYGKFICERFTESLSKLGIAVISGFARGIDSVAHRVCLKEGNLTYAVLGSGVDIVYPYDNRKLYNDLCEHGALISEFRIGSKPEKVNFPKRNRIISGISLGTLVIESGIKGGSLLTAEFALDQSKEVFAVPGYINSRQSEGTNDLIKKGQAKLITDIEDVLAELENKLKPVLKKEFYKKQETVTNDLNFFEKKIYDNLDYETKHIDSITEETGLSISDCLVNLLSLEFKGLIKQLPGKKFLKM